MLFFFTFLWSSAVLSSSFRQTYLPSSACCLPSLVLPLFSFGGNIFSCLRCFLCVFLAEASFYWFHCFFAPWSGVGLVVTVLCCLGCYVCGLCQHLFAVPPLFFYLFRWQRLLALMLFSLFLFQRCFADFASLFRTNMFRCFGCFRIFFYQLFPFSPFSLFCGNNQQATTHHRRLGGACFGGLRKWDDGRETSGAAPVYGEAGLEAEPSRTCRIGTSAAREVEGGVFCLVPKGHYGGTVGVVCNGCGSVIGFVVGSAQELLRKR